jgi:hypothetical protein
MVDTCGADNVPVDLHGSGGGTWRWSRARPRSNGADAPHQFSLLALGGTPETWDLPAGSMAFTCCQVPVCYRLGDARAIELERRDGSLETIAGAELGVEASAAIFGRRGTYRRITVTVRADDLLPDAPNASPS